ncbi:MAG TPA: FliM/FliN family flagellar motor switch protein [Polyangia bacterium]|nr:FliM/FliN family flagellar motor switch protein [Polyangia bacterium]
MSSPLDQNEVDALMAAIQDGRVGAEAGEQADVPVIPYDLTSQDRIIRGQMPTLDSINDRIASVFGSNLGGRTRLDLRAAPNASTLMKFSDVAALFNAGNTVWIASLGPGHGLAVLMLESGLCRSLLAGALGDRKARPEAGQTEMRADLTNVERRVLRNLLGIFCEAMAISWAEVLPFHPEVIRFESDPRMAMVAAPTDLAILCSYEISGAATGRLQIAIPYATVEPVKKSLTSPPRAGSSVDVRFAAALAKEMEGVRVQVRVEMGRTRINFSRLLELQVGDLLVLDASESSPLPIYVQGRKKMAGTPRVVSGSLAVVLEGGLRSAAPPEQRPGAGASAGKTARQP